jgi:hypothetical protein
MLCLIVLCPGIVTIESTERACNDHGTCSSGTSGNGSCTCSAVWKGSECQVSPQYQQMSIRCAPKLSLMTSIFVIVFEFNNV